MPSSVRSRYNRVAVVEVDPSTLAALGRHEPAFIGRRARGVRRVVWVDVVPAEGKTPRSGLYRARAYARELADRLNAEAGQK